MDRRAGSIAAGSRLAAAGALVAALSGCGIGIATSAGVGSAYNLGLLLGVTAGNGYVGIASPLDPDRRVLEQDCTKPIEDPSANLRCR